MKKQASMLFVASSLFFTSLVGGSMAEAKAPQATSPQSLTTKQASERVDYIYAKINQTIGDAIKKNHWRKMTKKRYNTLKPALRKLATAKLVDRDLEDYAFSYDEKFCKKYPCMPDSPSKGVRLSYKQASKTEGTVAHVVPDTTKNYGGYTVKVDLTKSKGQWLLQDIHLQVLSGDLKLSKKEILAYLKANGHRATYVKQKHLVNKQPLSKKKSKRTLLIFSEKGKRFGIYTDVANWEYNKKLVK
ncbi:lipoprotein, putative [Fictibacillus macauensis ZFHKF-1]|uniref:Lipoprotein, putative n=1 Tax=Fictibacillus macauensis ZFHKF-1 TaxID=1196324 RepID=I8AK88_9BACL|nr:hypothetical protein [Fictibacillus macauensis]EIT86262.1 lipoprotein, putative [Fictibacillus macauensis ZFHKF-1]